MLVIYKKIWRLRDKSTALQKKENCKYKRSQRDSLARTGTLLCWSESIIVMKILYIHLYE
jgi:hypothetical protein